MYKFSPNVDQEDFNNIPTELEPFEKELVTGVFFRGNKTEMYSKCNNYVYNDNYDAFIYSQFQDKPGMLDYMFLPWAE
jgi:hypothetical protein